jgi:hypothetical protein
VLRETCDRVLEDEAVSAEKRRLRAVALGIIGQAYMDVRPDSGDDALEDAEAEYVRVETKTSRARADGAGAPRACAMHSGVTVCSSLCTHSDVRIPARNCCNILCRACQRARS